MEENIAIGGFCRRRQICFPGIKTIVGGSSRTGPHKVGAGAREEPVLLVAGDSGSGKTHLILESGIEPELLSGNAYRGAPTASANIWRARGVTLLEIGGEFSTSSGIWHHLGALLSESRMRVLTRARPKARAVGWCLDSSLLLPNADPGALRAAADRAWRHCEELAAALDRTVPVYAIVTKLDRLPGFHEYVAPMDEMERAMPLGVTLP